MANFDWLNSVVFYVMISFLAITLILIPFLWKKDKNNTKDRKETEFFYTKETGELKFPTFLGKEKYIRTIDTSSSFLYVHPIIGIFLIYHPIVNRTFRLL